jgi:ribosomal protein L10
MDRGRGTIVNYLDTDFGRVTKVYDRNLASTDALLLPAGHVELCTLRPFVIERLAKVADSDEVMMLMEIGCKVHAERWAAKFSGLTTA